jgi:predicted enzyme related to lactoylglutathione lyase
MPGPAHNGTLIYALQLDRMVAFYAQVLAMRPLLQDAEHAVLQNADAQLVLHAIPPAYADGIVIDTPPKPRDTQAIKPFFTVASLAQASLDTQQLGGGMLPPAWDGPGFRALNAFDPEGNIVQLREPTG